MSSNKKFKRRLKKSALVPLISLVCSFIVLVFGFTSLVKSVSSFTNDFKKSEKEQIVLESTDSEKEEIKKEETNKVEQKPSSKKKPVIIIDPTFGGEYAGSKGYNGILQKDVNLDIALKVKKSLERYNDIDVVLTREGDETVPYEDRVALIKEKNADVVVSIQQNTEGTGTAEGIETYILNKETYPDRDGSLGYLLQKAMMMYSTTIDRGVMARNTDILIDAYKNGAVGAVVYTGFITNEKESKNLTNKEYTEKLAEGIAQGILSYVDNELSKKEEVE